MTANSSFVGTFGGNAEHLTAQFAKHPTTQGKATNLERAKRLAPLYILYGTRFNLRADLAWAQMEHETGFLTFTGDVKPEQNNFAGIGATGGVPGNSFENEELGIIAHYAHLAWYYYPGHVNKFCSKEYDPRHFGEAGNVHPRYNGDITLNRLAGSWAVPGAEYTKAVVKYAQEVNNIFVQPDIPSSEYDIIVQMGHVGRTSGFTGTAGEQDFVKAVGTPLARMLQEDNINVRLMGADDWLSPEPNKTVIFLSLHADGSLNVDARGFSCGYKIGTNQRFKDCMAISYKEFTNFTRRSDNYTDSMRNYYAWRDYNYKPTHVVADFYLLLEHGFLTNSTERAWLTSHTQEIAEHHHQVITKFLKEIGRIS